MFKCYLGIGIRKLQKPILTLAGGISDGFVAELSALFHKVPTLSDVYNTGYTAWLHFAQISFRLTSYSSKTLYAIPCLKNLEGGKTCQKD